MLRFLMFLRASIAVAAVIFLMFIGYMIRDTQITQAEAAALKKHDVQLIPLMDKPKVKVQST